MKTFGQTKAVGRSGAPLSAALAVAGAVAVLTAAFMLGGCATSVGGVPGPTVTPAPGPATVDHAPTKVSPSAAEMEEAAAARSSLVGVEAPDFTLVNHDNEPVRLADMRDRWIVLYFYPADDTPGCTCQATEFTDLLGRFHNMNAVVMGVSPDMAGSHRFFRQKYKIEVTLLSDSNHEVMSRYGAWTETKVAGRAQGRVIRSTFLIDPAGRIAYHWPEVIPNGHAARVGARLEKIRTDRGVAQAD